MSQDGRSRQRQRTRAALVAGALSVMRQGAIPSVAEAAAEAGISRATAYRYFSDAASLIGAVLADTVRPLSFEAAIESLPADPFERLDRYLDEALRIIPASEVQLRTALRLALEQNAATTSGTPIEESAIERGTRVGYLRQVLAPLQPNVGQHTFDRAVAAMSLAVGIEGYIVLHDLCRLDPDQIDDVVRWTCRTIIEATQRETTPPSTPQSPRDEEAEYPQTRVPERRRPPVS